MAGPEKLVEDGIKNRLEAHGFWYMKVWGGSGVKKGVPDILSVINGCFVSWEVKRADGKGRITPVQKQNAVDIAKNKGLAVFISQLETFDTVVKYIENDCRLDGLNWTADELSVLHLNEDHHDIYDGKLYEGIWR